jgi:hypothetical protein
MAGAAGADINTRDLFFLGKYVPYPSVPCLNEVRMTSGEVTAVITDHVTVIVICPSPEYTCPVECVCEWHWGTRSRDARGASKKLDGVPRRKGVCYGVLKRVRGGVMCGGEMRVDGDVRVQSIPGPGRVESADCCRLVRWRSVVRNNRHLRSSAHSRGDSLESHPTKCESRES